MTNLTPNAIITSKGRGPALANYTVQTIWTADVEIDRPSTHHISCGSDRELAERLARAINDGAFWSDASIREDVNGDTYVSADGFTIGKYLREDLPRLGY